MILLLLAILALNSARSSRLASVPVNHTLVTAADTALPISESVLAITWDGLRAKPTTPLVINLACIVFARSGAPSTCVPASVLPPGRPAVDWVTTMDAAQRASLALDAAGRERLELATIRATTLRLHRTSDEPGKFDVRMINVVIEPSDERPAFLPGESFRFADLELAEPLEQRLLSELFPIAAMRYGIEARVTITCLMEADLQLLCRDPGNVQMSADPPGNEAGRLTEDFRLASYQFASTIRLKPKSRSGVDVAGRRVTLSLVWKMPG